MFGLLKKKITTFIDQLTKKEEQKDENQTPSNDAPLPNLPQRAPPVQQIAKPQTHTPIQVPKSETIMDSNKTDSVPHAISTEPKTKPEKPIETTVPKEKTENTDSNPLPTSLPTKIQPTTPTPKPEAEIRSKATVALPKPTPPQAQKERKLEAKLGIATQIKGIFTREVQIQPSELEPMLDELNMALLESDVTLDTAEHIVATIKTQLSGRKVDKSRVQAEIHAAVKTALVEVLDKPPLDLIAFIQAHDKPVKILLLGPNGAGKTTTLAKIAHYLKEHNIRVVLAAADTFRAAAIEQLQHHGTTIGVPVIKHQYGADPAAVAFDAITHAKAHGLDVVLIDTAGRQETNLNLLKEMEKINRVVQPDLKLFIGEAVAGHALVEQAKTFHASLKLDGVILTKVDCDAKGGASFSVAHEVGVPIVLLGTGQNYGDIRPFDAKWLVANVLAE